MRSARSFLSWPARPDSPRLDSASSHDLLHTKNLTGPLERLQVNTVVIVGLIQRDKSLRTAIRKQEGLHCQGKQENAKARQVQETRDSAAACLVAFRG